MQVGGIKGDVMDNGLLRTTILETGQWVDGNLTMAELYLLLIALFLKNLILTIRAISLFYGMK